MSLVEWRKLEFEGRKVDWEVEASFGSHLCGFGSQIWKVEGDAIETHERDDTIVGDEA